MQSQKNRAWAYEHGCLWALDFSSSGHYKARVAPKIPAAFAEIPRLRPELVAGALSMPEREQFLQRLSTGRRCFVARVGGEMAAYGWVSQFPECIGELEREIQIGVDEAYIWDCGTLPAYQRQRLYSALISQMAATLCCEGVRRVWIGSSLSNRPSIRGFINAGFQPVLSLVYARLARLRCMLTFGVREAPKALVHLARDKLISRQERVLGPLALAARSPAPLPACTQIEARP